MDHEFVNVKSPGALLDYSVDWSTWLKDDEIEASSWTVPTGLTMTEDAFSLTVATVWLAGGTLGDNHEVTNSITTAGGRTDQRTILIKVRQK